MLDHKAKAELRARVLDQLNSIFDLDVQEQATAFPPQVRYFFFLLPLLTDLDPLVAKTIVPNRCKTIVPNGTVLLLSRLLCSSS